MLKKILMIILKILWPFNSKWHKGGAHIKAILGNLKLTSLNLIPLIEPKLEVVGGKDLSRGVNRTREGARCM